MAVQKILIVEDEQHLADGLRFNLEAEGFEVEVAVDGAIALERLAATSFDAVVLDVMLPKVDGFEVARTMRERADYTPILMLTARGRPEDVLIGFEAGTDDYLAKPFDLEAWLAEREVPVAEPKPKDGGRIWVFPVCPWNPQHTNGSAFVMQLADGPIAAGCHHNGCQGKGWRDLRELYEPEVGRPRIALPPSLAAAPADIVKKFEAAVHQQLNN